MLQNIYFSEKTAKILPIYTRRNQNILSVIISLLSQFSKILEKLFHIRLINFVDSNTIGFRKIYGFRKSINFVDI